MLNFLTALSLAFFGGDVDRLGDDDWYTREAAQRRLERAWPLSLPAALSATNSRDAEVAKRAGEVADRFRDLPRRLAETVYIHQVMWNWRAMEWNGMWTFGEWIEGDPDRKRVLLAIARSAGGYGVDDDWLRFAGIDLCHHIAYTLNWGKQ